MTNELIKCQVCYKHKKPYKNEQYICNDCAGLLKQQLYCGHGAKNWIYLYFNSRTDMFTVSPIMQCPYNDTEAHTYRSGSDSKTDYAFGKGFERNNKDSLSSSYVGSYLPENIEEDTIDRLKTPVICPRCKRAIMIYDVRVGRQWLLVKPSGEAKEKLEKKENE